MKAQVPYLPISEFEANDLNEILSKNGKEDNEKFEKSISVPDTHPSVDEDKYCRYVGLILEGMGMGKYIPLFINEDISLDVLLHLNADDLNSLGITNLQDQKCILDNLDEFNVGNDTSVDLDLSDINYIEDDLIMAKNMNIHLIQLNKHITEFLIKLSRSNLEDYFVSNKETAVKIFKKVTKQAVTQTNRISDILFDGNFNGDSLVVSFTRANNIEISELTKEKLIKYSRGKRKLKKGRIIMTVLAIGFAVSLVFFRRRL